MDLILRPIQYQGPQYRHPNAAQGFSSSAPLLPRRSPPTPPWRPLRARFRPGVSNHSLHQFLSPPRVIFWSNMILKPILGWLWCLIHMAISLFDLWSCLSNKLECYLISSKLLSTYQILHLERLKCLGVVLDSREAKNVKEVKQLLQWFSTAGIKYVVLYDMEGVLKESIEPGIEASSEEETSNLSDVCANTKSPHCSHGGMVVECLSGSDGKEAIAKAANLLYSASRKGCNSSTTYTRYDKMDSVFTEAHMATALRAVGSRGPEPDLLLVYGPVRCHLGFPAWRLRYTEIMHMGPLKSMRYSSIVKVLCQFAQKHQNYGT